MQTSQGISFNLFFEGEEGDVFKIVMQIHKTNLKKILHKKFYGMGVQASHYKTNDKEKTISASRFFIYLLITNYYLFFSWI